MKSLLLGLISALAFAPNAYAANIVYSESSQGDFSGDNLNPTKLNLSRGSNVIIGSTTGNPNLDQDFFSITIPSGYTLTEIILANYQGLDDDVTNQGFLAVQVGSLIEDGTITGNEPQLLGAATIGGEPGKQVGDNILDDLGRADSIRGFSFVGFPSGVLTQGTYTFWIQETRNGIKEYQLDFVLSQTPEPSTILGLGMVMGIGMLLNRKRLLHDR
ncbi:PEP-CTERM sorting domain-containing protein [Nostoc parmelioides]|uniref:PEP-CTERM sorting domain-containing protein n=1 Tax=Nostoc parmelioides FACHB-3921 TaxID=2692909 RepID=A0ABR8BPC1_9NOSO|nr:PEP-CTERM sorting domain-containing protein [Nostoc parmelioides]MBD2255534.1 PEP-CTERM sorting domain-containing protein [Nostoc parmelioides FACHB-3921]